MGQPLIASILALLLLTTGVACATGERVLVTPGPSDEMRDPLDGVSDRSGIAAYEFGRCESDADCLPRACDMAVCSPDERPAVCTSTPLGLCLGALDTHHCGCAAGFCRWERNTAVMHCAARAVPRPQSMGATGRPDAWYPSRISH